MGWLNARPKRHEKDTNPAANLERYPHPQDPIKFPPSGDEYVVEAFYKCGICSRVGDMNEAPLSWQEIQAFKQTSGYPLTSWECRMVRLMSETYLKQKAMASKEIYKEPWDGWVDVVSSDDYPQELWDQVNAARAGSLGDFLEYG